MKMIQSALLRAACTIIIGVLLIKYREETVTWLTIAIGALFLLSGVISIAAYYSARRNPSEVEVYDAQGRLIVSRTPTFPIVGLGSVILGLILALMPGTFVKWLMYFLALILILGAINQIASLAAIRRFSQLASGWWLCPSIVLLAGIVIMVRPQWVASAPLIIIGSFMILYGIVEVINSLKIHAVRRRLEREQQSPETDVPPQERIEDQTANDAGSFGV